MLSFLLSSQLGDSTLGVRKGYWHVRIASQLEYEEERTWLCIRRVNLPMANQDSASVNIYPNWAENMYKRLHDPLTMAKQSSKKSKAKKEAHAKTPKKRGRKVARAIFKSALPTNMNYVVKQIPKHSLKFGSTYNTNFLRDLALSIGDRYPIIQGYYIWSIYEYFQMQLPRSDHQVFTSFGGGAGQSSQRTSYRLMWNLLKTLFNKKAIVLIAECS